MDTLPLPAATTAATAALDGDSAIDSLVFALDDGTFATFYRADGSTDAALLGVYSDPDVAALAGVNRRAFAIDAMTICNGCDAAVADPDSAAGYCASCSK